MNIGNRVVQQTFKVGVFVWLTGRFFAEPSRHHLHLTENHIGMIDKVAVHLDTVFIGIQVYPIRFNVNDTVTLLENQNIGYDLCSGVSLKGVVRQTDRAEKLRALGDILSDGRTFFVHCAF